MVPLSRRWLTSTSPSLIDVEVRGRLALFDDAGAGVVLLLDELRREVLRQTEVETTERALDVAARLTPEHLDRVQRLVGRPSLVDEGRTDVGEDQQRQRRDPGEHDQRDQHVEWRGRQVDDVNVEPEHHTRTVTRSALYRRGLASRSTRFRPVPVPRVVSRPSGGWRRVSDQVEEVGRRGPHRFARPARSSASAACSSSSGPTPRATRPCSSSSCSASSRSRSSPVPGIVYVLRKRNAWVKKKLPGGTMPWIRSHLYLPILALVAAFVHATVVPFRPHLSSGKVLLVLGVLVSIAGVARHHLIGVQKAALNVNVAISKMSTGQPRDFRRLVADFTDTARPVEEIDAEMAKFPPTCRSAGRRSKRCAPRSTRTSPAPAGSASTFAATRSGGRCTRRSRSCCSPCSPSTSGTCSAARRSSSTTRRTSSSPPQSCAGCHSRTYEEWAASAMTHAQTSTITVAQLPVTLAQNRELVDTAARDNGGLVPANNNNPDHEVQQGDLFDASAKVCTTCHAQVGARFAPNADALLPFDAEDSAGVKAKGVAVSGGGAAVQTDGVGCTTCHGTAKAAGRDAGRDRDPQRREGFRRRIRRGLRATVRGSESAAATHPRHRQRGRQLLERPGPIEPALRRVPQRQGRPPGRRARR